MDWDHLRTFEAVIRHGSMTAAARALGISQSTASRHLAQLEDEAATPLLLRESPLRATERGEAVLAAVRPMVDAATAVQAAFEAVPMLRGVVTMTTVGELVRWVLTPRLTELYARHPQLQLRLLADNHIASLAAGEADMALRFARPERGDLVTRKLHTERYSLYASANIRLHDEVPWLGLAGSLAGIPEQVYVERAFANRPARLLVEDLESLGDAVAQGLGVALLPRGWTMRLESVVAVSPAEVGAQDLGPLPPRDLWLVIHRSKARLPKVRAVVAWLDDVFSTASVVSSV